MSNQKPNRAPAKKVAAKKAAPKKATPKKKVAKKAPVKRGPGTGAPAGNRFWLLRSKSGRDKIFSTPKILWKEACKYFDYCVENPLQEQDWVGKDGDEVIKDKMRAMTISGLCIFLDVNTKYFNDFMDGLKGKDDIISKEFSHVVTRIKDVIWTQKFEGAAAGLLQHNIIARELGLSEKSEFNGEVKNNNKNEQIGPVEVVIRNSGVPLASDEDDEGT